MHALGEVPPPPLPSLLFSFSCPIGWGGVFAAQWEEPRDGRVQEGTSGGGEGGGSGFWGDPDATPFVLTLLPPPPCQVQGGWGGVPADVGLPAVFPLIPPPTHTFAALCGGQQTRRCSGRVTHVRGMPHISRPEGRRKEEGVAGGDGGVGRGGGEEHSWPAMGGA